jgi:hypothetical protein
LIGVNVGGQDANRVKAVMEKEKLNWRSFADQGVRHGKWKVSGTPTFYIIDQAGVIRRKWVGSPGENAIRAALEPWIQEVERPSTK